MSDDATTTDTPVISDCAQTLQELDVFLDGVPGDVLDEKLDELGIDPRAFRSDVARIRRFTPGVLRRIIRRAPDMLALAGETLRSSGVGPKVRSWINN